MNGDCFPFVRSMIDILMNGRIMRYNTIRYDMSVRRSKSVGYLSSGGRSFMSFVRAGIKFFVCLNKRLCVWSGAERPKKNHENPLLHLQEKKARKKINQPVGLF
mmetsp:Transcript_269/g.653  ORF Transcript_269/g.653 Transcript_269/m.653 type:complete len:104 (-) Transcript_269:29-340(-)